MSDQPLECSGCSSCDDMYEMVEAYNGGPDAIDAYYGRTQGYAKPDGNKKNNVARTKAQVNLVPPALVIGASEAMEDGARKYGPFNWRHGQVDYMQYLGAILRHTLALLDGEDESGDANLHHLKHIAATAGIILDAIELGLLNDDRPIAGPAAVMLEKIRTKG